MTRERGSQYAGIETKKSSTSRPNTCIIYATSGNQVALDGTGGNHGVFTERLLNIMDSDESVDKVFKSIQNDLQRIFEREQVCGRV